MINEVHQSGAASAPTKGGVTLFEIEHDRIDLVRLYAEMHKILFAIPQKRYGMTAAESEELAQEAWCLFLEKRESIQLPRPWLTGTLVNLCRREIHQKTRSRTRHLEITLETHEMVGADGTGCETTLMVQQALQRLDDRSRLLCILIGMEQWSYEEVARELGLTVGSVGPLYMRAKKKLRQALRVTN